MHSFAIFLAWALVGAAWAWSSSEVSCASCGSECQAACGTRNFRACCFNFQRRRRTDPLLPHSVSDGRVDPFAVEALLQGRGNGARDPHLTQLLRSISRPVAGSAPADPAPASLSAVLARLAQGDVEDDMDDEVVEDDPPSSSTKEEEEEEGEEEEEEEGEEEDVLLPSAQDVSRLVALAALHHHLHHHPSPSPTLLLQREQQRSLHHHQHHHQANRHPRHPFLPPTNLNK
ncbi:uncharacterized protein [Panulirus ornatus]|uniref:uncharacterized protein n=1 Tax=Panulirus ornatus TaxID=150431 RepID=UPI003A8454AF